MLPDGPVVAYRWGDTVRAPTVMLVHGWNGWAQQMERFVEPLRAQGYAVLAFDHVAHGASAGEQATLPIMMRSVAALLDGMHHPAGIISHSLGAAAVAGVLADVPDAVPAAVLIAPPTDPRPFLRWVARGLGAPDTLLDDVQREAEAHAGVPMADLVADVPFARRLSTPLLVVHDTKDADVPIANGHVYAQAPNARLLVTDGLGHRRILRDLHVVDASVRFIAEQRDDSAADPADAACGAARQPGSIATCSPMSARWRNRQRCRRERRLPRSAPSAPAATAPRRRSRVDRRGA